MQVGLAVALNHELKPQTVTQQELLCSEQTAEEVSSTSPQSLLLGTGLRSSWVKCCLCCFLVSSHSVLKASWPGKERDFPEGSAPFCSHQEFQLVR